MAYKNQLQNLLIVLITIFILCGFRMYEKDRVSVLGDNDIALIEDFDDGCNTKHTLMSDIKEYVHDAYYAREFTDLATAISTIGATNATLIIDSSESLSANATFPATLSVEINKPGYITSNSTLTINGPFDAYMGHVFRGSGIVKDSSKLKYIYAQWFGAVGDGSTDDSTAIQEAADCCSGFCQTVALPAGAYILESAIEVNSTTVCFDFDPNAILYVKNNVAGIKSIKTGASAPSIKITGEARIMGVSGYTGYGIHITSGKLSVQSIVFYQTENWSIYFDRSGAGAHAINHSQIDRIYVPDAYGIKFEGPTAGAGSVSCEISNYMAAEDCRSELIYCKKANDIMINNIVGTNDLATTPAIKLEDAHSIMFGNAFVTSKQYYGYYIDIDCKNITFNGAETYDCKDGWYINGQNIAIGSMINLSADETSVEFGANCSAIQIGSMINFEGSTATPSADVVVSGSTSGISIGAVQINSSDCTYSFDLPSSNKVSLNNILLLSGSSAKFKNGYLPYRIRGGHNSAAVITENSGTKIGNGNATVYTITHDLKPSITPTVISVVAASADAGGDFYISAVSSTTITVTFASNTPAGTNNVSLQWYARATP